jgi:hypothetical protein
MTRSLRFRRRKSSSALLVEHRLERLVAQPNRRLRIHAALSTDHPATS